ncbi:UPF0488 protein C8orf33 homolog isoform X3 [Carettochelys insculpta]|uniref:UPF0488 protein C8orf33 homolog isoform X3 n=1 Tax=Carettochelys insculpta TaxID=44489 RepID=UPI003EB83982
MEEDAPEAEQVEDVQPLFLAGIRGPSLAAIKEGAEDAGSADLHFGAPKGTFQDELEWCILQLEMGLLHLNPTPEQAEETQHILKVLRSHKAPFVKKRQVMNRVFGDYRSKMAEEWMRTEKAAMKPGEAQIPQRNAQASGSIVYKKRSGQTSESTINWFTTSDNSFQFNFALSEVEPQANNGTVEEGQGIGGSEQAPISVSSSEQEGLRGVLNFSTPEQESKFAFNFVIPDADGPLMPSVITGQRAESLAEVVTSNGISPAELTNHSTLVDASVPEVIGSASGEAGREVPSSETQKPETAPVDEVGVEKTAAAGAPKKKKKKKKKPSNSKQEMTEAEVHKKVKAGASQCEGTDLSLQDKTSQQSDEQLWREVDWCVERLELGLKTQKSTPKQAEEAQHAVKILRSHKAVLAKKRQVMRAMFGDYRKKMEEERQKQLKLMQAAGKSAHVREVGESARRRSSQVFRRCSEASGKSPGSAGSPSHLPSHPESPQASGTNMFKFSTHQEEFRFNFF